MPVKLPGGAEPAGGQVGQPTGKPCPICGKPAVERSRPFCSERCREVDLNRWLSNSYSIPATRGDDDAGD